MMSIILLFLITISAHAQLLPHEVNESTKVLHFEVDSAGSHLQVGASGDFYLSSRGNLIRYSAETSTQLQPRVYPVHPYSRDVDFRITGDEKNYIFLEIKPFDRDVPVSERRTIEKRLKLVSLQTGSLP